MNYFKGLVLALDQLGNAIAGGNPDNTISARVGYYSRCANKRVRWYWLSVQRIINTTFYPLDGKGHCYQAYLEDKGEDFHKGSSVMRFILSLIIVASCPLIFVLLYPCWMVYGFIVIIKSANDPIFPKPSKR